VLEEKLSGRICVFADADRQHVMPFGTPQEVREFVRNTISIFNRSGGIMLRFELEPVWPYENIQAMYEAFEEFR
jgi:uroporphyrinogen decarboxylase